MLWQHDIASLPSISTPVALPMMISQPGASSNCQLPTLLNKRIAPFGFDLVRVKDASSTAHENARCTGPASLIHVATSSNESCKRCNEARAETTQSSNEPSSNRLASISSQHVAVRLPVPRFTMESLSASISLYGVTCASPVSLPMSLPVATKRVSLSPRSADCLQSEPRSFWYWPGASQAGCAVLASRPEDEKKASWHCLRRSLAQTLHTSVTDRVGPELLGQVLLALGTLTVFSTRHGAQRACKYKPIQAEMLSPRAGKQG